MTDDRRGPMTILHGDARSLPLPDESVDLIVTSPPYWSQRSYRDNGEHYAGQIGAERTPAEYITSMLDCTREWMRVLKPSGSIFVNLGDKQVNKRLLYLPERYRIACSDLLGLIGRAVIVWSKPNGLPESVTDRVRRSHEDWVHLTRLPRYFSAVDEIRETYSERVQDRQRYARRDVPASRCYAPDNRNDADRARGILGFGADGANPLGKLPGSVWEIATQPLRVPTELGVDHFAAFPMEWPRRIILGWSPSGICTACGEGRRPVADLTLSDAPGGARHDRSHSVSTAQGPARRLARAIATREITGEACACPDTSAPTRPAVVLDPFGGTGTTALVASVLGRHGISVDMSADYNRVAEWRTNDPKQRERAARGARPVLIPKQRGAESHVGT